MMKYGVHGAPHDVIKMCIFCNKIFRGFWSTGGQNFRFPIDFAGYRYNSAHCAACDNRNRLLLSVGKHRYFCLFLVFLKTVCLCTYWQSDYSSCSLSGSMLHSGPELVLSSMSSVCSTIFTIVFKQIVWYCWPRKPVRCLVSIFILPSILQWI